MEKFGPSYEIHNLSSPLEKKSTHTSILASLVPILPPYHSDIRGRHS